jgi:two-component system response regulator
MAASISNPGHDSKLILLIEDNEDDQRLTLRALRRNNIMNEVVVACDGQEAVDYLFGTGSFSGRDLTVMPAVVVLDLNLPGLSGLEVLNRIRQTAETKRIPVVVLTSSEDENQIEQAYSQGANSYVQKPNDPSEFSEMVLQMAMYWLLLNRTMPERMLA